MSGALDALAIAASVVLAGFLFGIGFLGAVEVWDGVRDAFKEWKQWR